MVKRICSLVTLMVLMLTQCFTSMNYVLAENNAEQDFQVEESINQEEEEEIINVSEEEENTDDLVVDSEDEGETMENSVMDMEENGEIIVDDLSDDLSDDGDSEKLQEEENIEILTSDIENDEGNTGNSMINKEDETVEVTTNTENNEYDIDNNGENVENLTINVEDEGIVEVTTNTGNTEHDVDNSGESVDELVPSVETGDNEEGIIDTITEEIQEIITKIKYFFKKEGDSRYIKYGKDRNNIGTITLKDPNSGVSITIMDKNLGAESVGVGKSSYGYYFQWGNNHGVKLVNSSNKTTKKAEYNDSYFNHGYDGQGVFIVGDTDYWEDGSHYNSLWGNESKESSRYGACPVGYHIPTMKEWNQLLNIWGKIHTQDSSMGNTVMRYSESYSTRNIQIFKGSATQCEQGDTECIDEDKLSNVVEVLSSELKLPIAGSYDENGNYHDGLGVYWTTISKNGNAAGVFDVNVYYGAAVDERLMYKSQGHTVRCFQNVEPYEPPVNSEYQTGIEGEGSSNDTSMDSQPFTQLDEAEQASVDESISNGLLSGVDYSLDTQNDGKDMQDFYTENDISSDIESDLTIQDVTGVLENETEAKECVITWKNEDGSVRDVTTVTCGEKPTYVDAYQPSDAQYTYTFAGWEPEITEAIGDTEYRAKYVYTLNKYTVTWKDEDGKVIRTDKVGYGHVPSYKGTLPVKDSTDGFLYTFAGWTPSIEEIKGDVTYTAKYTTGVRNYTITWKNEDGTIIDTTEVPYGQMPTHVDASQPSDVYYSYEFSGWDSEITEVTGPAEYRATYRYIANKYTVTWQNEDGSVLKTDEFVYGVTPIYDGELPNKQLDGVYEYTFAGWEPEIAEVTGDIVYIAKYSVKEIEQNIQDSTVETLEGQEDVEDDDNVLSGTEDLFSTVEGESYVGDTDDSQDYLSQVDTYHSEAGTSSVSQNDDNVEKSDISMDSSQCVEGQIGCDENEEDSGFFEGLRETLKSFFLDDEDGYLRGSETIDDIVVSVEAEEGTFPEGTEVVIKGVSQEKLESIQTSLIEDESNNVTEDAQILAFDISFVYSGEEIQPIKEVSVKFNYKDNSDFQGASMSELSVYHIDDETDEGEKIDVVNKDGDEIEILATSFSTYAVVAQKGLRSTPVTGIGIMDQMPDFEFTGIVINRPDSISNGPVFYIIMDRNLGATSTDTNNTDSYGYMYQWGNNYGFPSTGTSLPSNQVASKEVVNVDLTEYGPAYDGDTQYYSEIFITAPGSLNANKRYDWATTGNNNIWGDSTDKDEARQGPCPSGWHVPSMTEWSGAMAYWKAGSGNGSLNNFTTYLKLPKAGSRARSSADLQKSGEGRFYSSTPKGNIAYALTFKTGNPTITEPNNRVDALSVRCFKDELICEAGMHAELNGCVSNYKTGHCMTGDVQNGHYTGYMDEITIEWTGGTWYVPMCEIVCDEGFHENDNMCIGGFVSVTFDLNGGRWYDGSIGNRDSSIEMGVDISEVRPKQDPYKNGYMFMGWFDESSNSSYRFKFQGITITGDLTLTAHWAPFNDIVYTGIIDGNERKIVLMDRNMGATAIGVGRNASTDSYGFYYEWGNNYGFYFDPSKTINSVSANNARVNAGGYGPNTSSGRYYGETFINITDSNRMDWSSVVNNNLWGGGGDNATNDYDNRTSERYTRQGPCPKGYHVPSLGEWRDLVRLFYNNNGLGNFSQPWPDYVGTAGGNAMKDEPISTTNRDIFANTFNIPVAGRVQRTYVWERYGNKDNKPRAPFWSSSIKNGDGSLGFEVKFDGEYINIGGWNDERSQLKPVRCFKDLDDYTVTWKNYNGTVLETDDYVYQGATPTYNGLEDPIKDELSEFVGWYLEGDENQTIVDLSTESVDSDRAYVAKFIPIAPEDAYIVTVDIDPLSGGNVDKEPRYNSGDTVILTGTANSGYEFLGWFTGNNIVSLDNPYIFIADDSDGTGFTAVFSPLYSIYTGTNDELGGTVSYEVVNITRQGKVIRFTANVNESYRLDKWILNGDDVATGGSTQLDVILSGDISLTGYFISTQNTVTISVDPVGYGTVDSGSVTADNGTSISTSGNELIIGSTTVTAIPSTGTDQYTYTFSGWNNTCGNTLTGNCTITAIFDRTTNVYTATIVTSPEGYGIVDSGSVVAEYGTSISTSGNELTIGSTTVTATPSMGTDQYIYAFSGWSNTCGNTLTGNCVITAIFDRTTNVYTATIVASPEGYGTVDSGSVVAEYGTSISTNGNELTIGLTTILATPAETGAQYTYAFDGWTFSNCGSEGNYEIGPNCEITANFERTTNEYTVTIVSSDINSGTVTTGSITVLYGTSISKSGNIVTIGSETSTANANPQTWQYDFDFVDWTDTCGATVTTGCEITANFDSSLRSYTLDLVVGTGIELIYYKVNGEDNFISTGVSVIISGVEAGSMIYAYAEPKNGYIYADTSVDNPWSVLVTGNNIFSPEATSDSVQYLVYHYVKRVGENTYALTDTETRYGTADTIVSISSLARAEDFPCASLSGVRGSLTGTESGPGEIVTGAMIEGDGSTQIHIYYVRNYHEISLTGDAHVASLTGDGVRECGSDRPIGATPKPGYHFVRWEEREKEEKEDEDINGG